MRPLPDLRRTLERIDGRGYGGYKQIKGRWGDGEVELVIDHVQGDPFAAPSRVRLVLPADVHGIPPELWSSRTRRVALTDFLLRRFAVAARQAGGRSGSGHSGKLIVDEGRAEILARSGCGFDKGDLELRFRVGLPARGRRVLAREAEHLLIEVLPRAARCVLWANVPHDEAQAFVELAEDHAHLQGVLAERGLIAFVRDGSVLPRASGVSSSPLEGAVPFASPESLRVSLPTLHHGEVHGMGIPAGVTLITGGGFHGKTTLLEALQAGIDPHIPGDGREWVVTSPDVVKLRSEDGRSVVGVDLRAFIHDLPGGRDTASFTTADASGSTSLASAILEAMEIGAKAILLDEDTSATNLLIRDARMQALVARETITPLIDRVRELAEGPGVSTVLVVGGSGDYLEVADRVLLMEDFLPHDVSQRARDIMNQHPTERTTATPRGALAFATRRPLVDSFDPRRGRRSRVRARGLRELTFGEDTIDLSALEQLVDDSQSRAIGVLLEWLGSHGRDGSSVRELAEQALEEAAGRGLYTVARLPELALMRRYELAAAINRLRSLELLPA